MPLMTTQPLVWLRGMCLRGRVGQVCTAEYCADFYLVDGASRVFVNGSRVGHCRLQGADDGGKTVFYVPPTGIEWLVAHHRPNFTWDDTGRRTGRFAFTQQAYLVNDVIAALGVVHPGRDPCPPFASCPHLQPAHLQPVMGLTPQFFIEHQLDRHDQRVVEALCTAGRSVNGVWLSDLTSITQHVMPPPIHPLPAHLVAPTDAWQEFVPPPAPLVIEEGTMCK
jgi:hypothetical protein